MRRWIEPFFATPSASPVSMPARGWLIFALPPAEVAVHPTDGETRHELYLTCDNIECTLADLSNRGVEIVHPVADRGWGLLAAIRMPSGAEIGLYEPRHPTAYRRS